MLRTATHRLHTRFAKRFGASILKRRCRTCFSQVLLFAHKKWTLGVALYSAAISMKMNPILFAPALGVVLLVEAGLARSVALSGPAGGG